MRLLFIALCIGAAYPQLPTKRPADSHLDFFLSAAGGEMKEIGENTILYRNMPEGYYTIYLRVKNLPSNYGYSIWLSDTAVTDSIDVIINRADTLLRFSFSPPSRFKDNVPVFFCVTPNGFGPTYRWSNTGTVYFKPSGFVEKDFSPLLYAKQLSFYAVCLFLFFGIFLAVQWRKYENLTYMLKNDLLRRQLLFDARSKLLIILKIAIPLSVAVLILENVYPYYVFNIGYNLEMVVRLVLQTVLPFLLPQLLLFFLLQITEYKEGVRGNHAGMAESLMLNMSEYEHGENKGMMLLRFQFLLINMETLSEDYKDKPDVLYAEILSSARQVQTEVLPSLQRILMQFRYVASAENFGLIKHENVIIELLDRIRTLSNIINAMRAGKDVLIESFPSEEFLALCRDAVEPLEKIRSEYTTIRASVLRTFKVSVPMIFQHIKLKYEELETLRKSGIVFSIEMYGDSDAQCLFGYGDIIDTLSNIINNAVEELALCDDEIREITVSINAADDVVVFTIADTGRGIPENQINSVFKKGYSSKGKNRGNGLYLSLRNIRKYQGIIEVMPHQPRGTKFILSLRRI